MENIKVNLSTSQYGRGCSTYQLPRGGSPIQELLLWDGGVVRSDVLVDLAATRVVLVRSRHPYEQRDSQGKVCVAITTFSRTPRRSRRADLREW